jgi:hypothetical protein
MIVMITGLRFSLQRYSSQMIAYFHRDFRSGSRYSLGAKTSFQAGKDNAWSASTAVPNDAFSVTLLSGFISLKNVTGGGN